MNELTFDSLLCQWISILYGSQILICLHFATLTTHYCRFSLLSSVVKILTCSKYIIKTLLDTSLRFLKHEKYGFSEAYCVFKHKTSRVKSKLFWQINIPEILYNRSPSSCTELYRILQLSSNNPFSSSGNNNSIAVLAYMLIILWPAFNAVSLTYSDSSARAYKYIQQIFNSSARASNNTTNI
jgi:hypothetical protein